MGRADGKSTITNDVSSQNLGSVGSSQGVQSGKQSENQQISRKMAQTYLSGLSKGYISKIDNMKLINNCLHNSNAMGTGNSQHSKLNKSLDGSKLNNGL